MANGERCRTCGCQEATHQWDPDQTCTSFKSEVSHKRGCPVVDCDGDCAASIARRDKESDRMAARLTHAWFLSGPHLIVIDIGS